MVGENDGRRDASEAASVVTETVRRDLANRCERCAVLWVAALTTNVTVSIVGGP